MTMSITTAPAHGEIGHNSIVPTPAQITEEMKMRFEDMSMAAVGLLDRALHLPEKVGSREDLGTTSRVILDIRTLAKAAEATREAEKGPYWRAGLAVDAFFKDIITRLEKTTTILDRRVNDYQQAILAAERRKRDEEARAAARIAEEARQKAERARSEAARASRQVEADLAARRAEEALEATQATPAGMTRERFEDGPLVTMKKIRFAEVVDFKAIPLEELRPYLKPSAIEEAVQRWAKATEYSQTMGGVRVGERDESVVR